MKIVRYRVKEDHLYIYSNHDADSRMGWYKDAWIIDIGFAQQWLDHYRRWSISSLFSLKSIDDLMESQDSISILTALYQAILKEDWSRLFIHGEPVSLPEQEVQLLSPLMDPRKLKGVVHNSFYYPLSIISPGSTVQNAKKALPGIAFMLGIQKESYSLIGCCLINCWLTEDGWISSLGPYLFITDQWRVLADQWLIVRRNDEVIYRKKIDLWQYFQVKKQTWSSSLSFREMVGTVFDSLVVAVEPRDRVEIEMEDLGRLQNGVDKT